MTWALQMRGSKSSYGERVSRHSEVAVKEVEYGEPHWSKTKQGTQVEDKATVAFSDLISGAGVTNGCDLPDVPARNLGLLKEQSALNH